MQVENCLEPRQVEKVPAVGPGCKHAVTSVQYNIYHAGAMGGEAVEAVVVLQAGESSARYIQQTHSYRHYWAGENRTVRI